MTNLNLTPEQIQTVSIRGQRESGFKSSHIVGAVAGVLTAAANYNQGSSLAGAAAGAALGGAMGYAIGDIFGITDDLGTSARILNGGVATLVGVSFSGLATGLVDALVNPKAAE